MSVPIESVQIQISGRVSQVNGWEGEMLIMHAMGDEMECHVESDVVRRQLGPYAVLQRNVLLKKEQGRETLWLKHQVRKYIEKTEQTKNNTFHSSFQLELLLWDLPEFACRTECC